MDTSINANAYLGKLLCDEYLLTDVEELKEDLVKRLKKIIEEDEAKSYVRVIVPTDLKERVNDKKLLHVVRGDPLVEPSRPFGKKTALKYFKEQNLSEEEYCIMGPSRAIYEYVLDRRIL